MSLSDFQKLTLAHGTYVYTLRLRSPVGEAKRFYVGSSDHVQVRVAEHFHSGGAAFTKKFAPLEIWNIKPGDRHDEAAETRSTHARIRNRLRAWG
jgi:predicted GIY-YIG superfamily endonuclease